MDATQHPPRDEGHLLTLKYFTIYLASRDWTVLMKLKHFKYLRKFYRDKNNGWHKAEL